MVLLFVSAIRAKEFGKMISQKTEAADSSDSSDVNVQFEGGGTRETEDKDRFVAVVDVSVGMEFKGGRPAVGLRCMLLCTASTSADCTNEGYIEGTDFCC